MFHLCAAVGGFIEINLNVAIFAKIGKTYLLLFLLSEKIL
jgi:hypothetical protein